MKLTKEQTQEIKDQQSQQNPTKRVLYYNCWFSNYDDKRIS